MLVLRVQQPVALVRMGSADMHAAEFVGLSEDEKRGAAGAPPHDLRVATVNWGFMPRSARRRARACGR
jgi:hypothetical protein